MRSRGRPRTLLSVPCDKHGDGACPSPNGCVNRRLRAGLPVVRPMGKREARRLASAAVAMWARAALEIGSPILDDHGQPIDPDGPDHDAVRDAIDEMLDLLDPS